MLFAKLSFFAAALAGFAIAALVANANALAAPAELSSAPAAPALAERSVELTLDELKDILEKEGLLEKRQDVGEVAGLEKRGWICFGRYGCVRTG